MVYVTEDWDGFKAYAENCRVGTFQIKDVVEGVEFRVRAGRLGYIGIFTEEDDENLKLMLKFCRVQGFIRVETTLSDELFHI